jgi:antirestriction protein ArdC
MANSKIYDLVTEKIIEKLEEGVVPWRKPWRNGGPVNWKTQRPYRGINTMLLEEGEYATFKQITEAGGKIKKGAKSEIIVFWKFLKKENEEGEEEKIPYLKYFRVFNIEKSTEGLELKREIKEQDHDPIEEAEAIRKNYFNPPSYTYLRAGAFYQPNDDHINVPPLKDFEKPEEFYNTLFHEMIHSTGHNERLKRKGVTGIINFGSETYSKEELIAEMGASMLSATVGFEHHTLDNSASYIKSWLKKLKEDKTLVIKASGQAQKAVDHILGTQFEEKGE